MDSGYSSLRSTPSNSTTPDKSNSQPLKLFPAVGHDAETSPRRVFSPRPDLTSFDTTLDDGTHEWFQATAPRIEQLLFEFLKSGRRFLSSSKFRPIAVRLMVLGRSETSARPHLVVFAPPKGSKKIERFFERDEIKELLVVPGGSDPVEVVVAAHTTGFLMCLISDIKVLCSADITSYPPRHTLCGLPIVVNSRRMTFGGVIRVLVHGSDNQQVWKLYGLSAGHFMGNEEGESELDESDDDSDSDIGAGSADDDPMHDQPTIHPALPIPTVPEVTSWDWQGDMTLGNILDIGDSAHGLDSPDLDWSLIHMNYLLPNFLNLASSDAQEGDYWMAALEAPHSPELSIKPSSTKPHRSVIVTSGTRGLQRGTLQGTSARVLLGRSETFSNAYILRLDRGTVGPGDSGSWVIDPHTSEVLGHVVAKDAFGDAYVISMADILNDIKSRLGCIDIELPSWRDIFPGVTSQNGVSYGTVASSIGSRKMSFTGSSTADSGYHTLGNSTPLIPPPSRPAPKTTGIHAIIRDSLPQDIGTSPLKSASPPPSSGLNESISADTVNNDERDSKAPLVTSTESIYSAGFSSGSRSSGSSSRGSGTIDRYYKRGRADLSFGYTTRVQEIPRRNGPGIVLIQHNPSAGSSSRREEKYSSQPTYGSSGARNSSYYK